MLAAICYLLVGFFAGCLASQIAYVLFRAELLGWQKRRQARFLQAQALLFARKLDAGLAELDRELNKPPLQFPQSRPLVVDGTHLKPRQLKRMIERLVNEDHRRFLSIEGGGNH